MLFVRLALLNFVLNAQSVLGLLQIELANSIIKSDGQARGGTVEGLLPGTPKTVGQIGFRA